MLYAQRKTHYVIGHKMAVWLLLLSLVVMTAGCGTACKCSRSGDSTIASAPERVEIDGQEFTLSANAWRDFQPIAPPDGRPLNVIVKVRPTVVMLVKAGLSVDCVWVLNGRAQWSAAPEKPSATPQHTESPFYSGVVPQFRLEAVVRGGPKWGPGIKVDVVARLRQGKQTWLLRAAGVEIKRTD